MRTVNLHGIIVNAMKFTDGRLQAIYLCDLQLFKTTYQEKNLHKRVKRKTLEEEILAAQNISDRRAYGDYSESTYLSIPFNTYRQVIS